ncbi:MAG: TylF/MycF family methyltransferase [Candidatus Adiutrix sp.]|nr:TylF/MycF family methyltransferase [Candidatus Adiutrix sp.]
MELHKIRDWLTAPFRLEYNPDSLWHFKAHPEAAALFKLFVKGQENNNSGDFSRFFSLLLNLKMLGRRNVPGDFAEVGVYKGNTAAILAYYAAKQQRKLYLFDTFKGFDDHNLAGVDAKISPAFQDADFNEVKKLVGHPEVCRYFIGLFPDSLPLEMADKKFAFVSLDCDLYQPMKAGLNFFFPRMASGGLLFLHDYSSGFWPGATQAVEEFIGEHSLSLVLLPDKSGTPVLPAAGSREASASLVL